MKQFQLMKFYIKCIICHINTDNYIIIQTEIKHNQNKKEIHSSTK